MKLVKNFFLLALGIGQQVIQISSATPTLDSLARSVERVESIRDIKDVQRCFAQLAQHGRWADMAALFYDNGTLRWGNETATGPAAIENWLRIDSAGMDGVRPGSLDTMIVENGLVTLSVDGRRGKARWNGLRFMGDGLGGTRIQGGIYQNEYVFSGGQWKISLLKYFPLYSGPYIGGWRTVGGSVPIVPYHFYEPGEDPGVPIKPAIGEPPSTRATIEQLAQRISRMNDEDSIRNIQHSYGYYVDRRMWNDVVDLFASNAVVKVTGVGTYQGKAGVRQAMEQRMGPEGLAQGVLNDHPIFDLIVDVSPNGREAVARGVEVGMIGNANIRAASWEFNVFRTQFRKGDDGQWRMFNLELTSLINADYYKGWGSGASAQGSGVVPEFSGTEGRAAQEYDEDAENKDELDLVDLQRRLSRSAAYDGAESVSVAYGYVIDDLNCGLMGALFAQKGHKSSPFCGFYQGPNHTAEACYTTYGRNRSSGLRTSISFHWRPQPVILVSEDGRSATLRARLLQPSTSNSSAGSFNGAIYHDQMVLENGKWRLWSITIDEFYWQSKNWKEGWAGANPRDASSPNPGPSALFNKYPPEVSLVEIGDREAGFQGAAGRFIQWPEIQRMWFHYRNPVRPDWSLTANGYQEPSTGPSLKNGTFS
ncbi:hypothetical protein BCR34DRAFT_618714 [Clohesyomyces aquaticus]|uniref:SnoaL-like domain-containing protein n=1 Tax=Clohesyomyces aquaticus TaxID=1231657 RepID=A0A1Y1YPZ0_9PLEO|nr:hypothetical protein BCR34DRAFT_618714 [Clohesyomyces aquaticus]